MHPARLLLDTLRFHQAPAPEQLAAAWTAVDVRGLRRLVALEGCAIWLYRRLRQLGVLNGIDPAFGAWVTASAREVTARNLLIDAEAQALAEIFAGMGLPHVFLKGVARRLTVDRYPLADARITSDVDVLVPADSAWEIWSRLRRLGYDRTAPLGPRRPQHHHLPSLWNERRVAVELHTTIAQRVSPAEAWRRHYEAGMDVERAGMRFRVPPATELFWNGTAHSMLHPELAFLLVLLFDASVIWASGASIEWEEVRRRLEAGEIVERSVAAAWLGAAADLAGLQPPAALNGHILSYSLEDALRLRLAVLRRVPVPPGLRKALTWWTSQRARSFL